MSFIYIIDNVRLFGYTRVSTSKQSTELQRKRLIEEGVIASRIFDDTASRNNLKRNGLDLLKIKVETGDSIIITKFDRLGSNTIEMIELINYFNDLNVSIRFLDDGITTGGTMGDMVIKILSAVADAERERILERTNEGRIEAKANGIIFGRKKSIDVLQLKQLLDQGISPTEITKKMKIGRSTIYKLKKEHGL